MSEIVLDSGRPQTFGLRLELARVRALEWLGLGSVVLVAAVVRFANLAALGYANHYYTAAIEAMMQNWHNFSLSPQSRAVP